MENGRPHLVDAAVKITGVAASGIDDRAVVALALVRALCVRRGG